MASVVIVGAGACGLLTSMLLAADGHEVTVLERDPAPPPDRGADPWREWDRRGVNQFRLLHFFAPRWRKEVEAELPLVVPALQAAGALTMNFVAGIPESITGGMQTGDEDFTLVTGRRPVVEAVLARGAASTPGVSIRRGVAVRGLRTGTSAASGVPHVVGVTTDTGEELDADLVLDVSGRRSALPGWLADIGARPPREVVEDCGFVYFGRHFRSGDGSVPFMFGPPLIPCGSISVLTLPADNGTWGIGVITSSRDAELRGLKDEKRWTEVVRRLPLVAHWLEGEPIDDDVAVMAKIEDRHREYVIDGLPSATGVAVVGDAWACTNPSVGRGATIGLLHAIAVRDSLRTAPLDDPLAFARRFGQATHDVVEPWYQDTLTFDRHRLAEIEAAISGSRYDPDDDEWRRMHALQFGAGQDPVLLRASIRSGGVFSTARETLADPDVAARVDAIGDAWRDAPVLGPDRETLVAMASA